MPNARNNIVKPKDKITFIKLSVPEIKETKNI